MACEYCNGSGMVFAVARDIPIEHHGWVASMPCVCTLKKEKEMLNDVYVGSIVTYLDDSGKYPCIKQGNVTAVCGTHYIVNDQRLHRNQLFGTGLEESNKALYQVTKIRINTLQALANQLGRHIADESI